MEQELNFIQRWFHENCDGDWEHNKNFVIESIDNPGWSVFINLEETKLENKEFQVVDEERSEEDWVYCVVEEGKFKAACGPFNLIEVLGLFRNWVE